MKATGTILALVWLLPGLFAAQEPPIITMNKELHHHLVWKSDRVRAFEINLAARDAIVLHGHAHDAVSIVIGAATTVTTIAGQADILTFAKPADVTFIRSGTADSMRNIGETAYRAVLVDLLRLQSGARNLCGSQIPNLPSICPDASLADSNVDRVDLPQFETDQMRVTLTRTRPRRQATFGEPDRDTLIVAIDEALIVAPTEKSAALTRITMDGVPSFSLALTTSGKTAGLQEKRAARRLPAGGMLWIAHGARRVLQNNSGTDMRVITLAFKP